MNEQEKNVVEYLTEHPDFFTTQPKLLAKLSVVHPQKGTLSLVEAQLEQQRQQIKTLTAFLEKFHQLAYQEADIFYALMPLQKKLFQAEDFQRGEEKLKQWAQSYELDGAKILLFRDAWQKNESIPEQYWIDSLGTPRLAPILLGRFKQQRKTPDVSAGGISHWLRGNLSAWRKNKPQTDRTFIIHLPRYCPFP